MWLLLPFLLLVVVACFAYVGARCFGMGFHRGVPETTRRLFLAVGYISVAFIAIGIQGILQQAIRQGWLPAGLRGWLFTWGTLILTIVVWSVAGVAFWLMSRVFKTVDRDARLVRVMITSPAVDVKASDLNLTAREFDVLEAIANGKLSDDEIAAAFHISPSTAATHVRNILKKADLHNRRDLVLIYAAEQSTEDETATDQ